jgi:hypothetical protein
LYLVYLGIVSQVSNRRKRQLALVGLGTLLLVSVIGANLALGAERTVTNPGFVTDEFEAAGVYESMANDMATEFQPDNATGTSLRLAGEGTEPPIEDIAETAVSPAYVQGQVERNVDVTYAYLDGDRADLPLTFNLTPVKADFAAGMAAWTSNRTPGELSPRMGRLAANESSFQETRAAFEQRQLDRIQNRTAREYTDSELRQIYDDNRDRVREESLHRVETRVDDQGVQEPVRSAAIDYGTVGVDALVAENASYEAFLADEAAARADLAAAVGTLTRQRLDAEAPDELDLTNGTNETRAALAPVRSGFTLQGILLYAFPLLALAAAVGIGSLSRRRSTGLWRVGSTVAVGGLLGLLGAVLVSRLVPILLEVDPASADPIVSALLGMVQEATGTLAVQSAGVLALGVVLVAGGVAVRRELLPIRDGPAQPASDGESPTDGESATDEEPTADDEG